MKYDPDLEESFYEILFEQYGFVPEKLPMKLAGKSREFYSCDEMGVELTCE